MRCAELAPSLPSRRHFQVCECAALNCTNKFAFIDGVAFPGRAKSGDDVRLYFFCSWKCIIDALPCEACYRA